MQVNDRTYFEEEQRMDSKWMWFFVCILAFTILGVGIPILVDRETDLTKVSIVMGTILFSDALILYLLKTMKLELAITKQGLQYRFFAMIATNGMVQWDDVASVTFRKSPHRGYGRKYKFRYGEVYAMGLRSGIEMQLKNGKRKFFSIKDLDGFKSGFNKLNLPIQLKSELN